MSLKKTLSPQQVPFFKRADWNAKWYCRERSNFPRTCGWTFPASRCPLAHSLKNSASQSRSCKCNPFCHQMMDTLVTKARDTYTAIPAQIKRENVRVNQNSGRHVNALMSGWVLCYWQKFLYSLLHKKERKKKLCRINANHELPCQPEVLTSNAIICQCLLWQRTGSFYPSEKNAS